MKLRLWLMLMYKMHAVSFSCTSLKRTAATCTLKLMHTFLIVRVNPLKFDARPLMVAVCKPDRIVFVYSECGEQRARHKYISLI